MPSRATRSMARYVARCRSWPGWFVAGSLPRLTKGNWLLATVAKTYEKCAVRVSTLGPQ